MLDWWSNEATVGLQKDGVGGKKAPVQVYIERVTVQMWSVGERERSGRWKVEGCLIAFAWGQG